MVFCTGCAGCGCVELGRRLCAHSACNMALVTSDLFLTAGCFDHCQQKHFTVLNVQVSRALCHLIAVTQLLRKATAVQFVLFLRFMFIVRYASYVELKH